MKIYLLTGALALLAGHVNAQKDDFDRYGPMGSDVCKDLTAYFKEPKKIYKLDLSYQKIDQKLYEKICTITDLQAVKLSGNEVSDYPKNMDKLINLVYLTAFPPNLKAYSTLHHLELQHTAIDSIPASIAYLNRLQTLRFGSTEDTLKLPTSLRYLKKLTEVNIENCIMDSLPKELFKINSLKYLFLSSTNTWYLSKHFENLPELEVMVIENNHLSSLPFDIYKAQKLRIISLRGNKLTRLPESIAQLENLTILDLKGNPLEKGELEKLKALLPGCEIRF
jgi:Leucine-rich repeat (LRR) protein